MATTEFGLLAELEAELEDEALEAEHYHSQALNLEYLVNFSTMGFDTTPSFRKNFQLVNRAFVKKGRQWTTRIFVNDFCQARHYAINIPGVGVKRFAVIYGFPVEYQIRAGQKPLLVNLGRWGGKFVSTLETKGRPVKRPHSPCELTRHSVARGLLNVGRSLLFPRKLH